MEKAVRRGSRSGARSGRRRWAVAAAVLVPIIYVGLLLGIIIFQVARLLRQRALRLPGAGLRLRTQPNAHADILKVLMPGTVLTVLEPASAARAKIGVTNQWLNVQEPGGTIGYVVAGYVTG